MKITATKVVTVTLVYEFEAKDKEEGRKLAENAGFLEGPKSQKVDEDLDVVITIESDEDTDRDALGDDWTDED